MEAALVKNSLLTVWSDDNIVAQMEAGLVKKIKNSNVRFPIKRSCVETLNVGYSRTSSKETIFCAQLSALLHGQPSPTILYTDSLSR